MTLLIVSSLLKIVFCLVVLLSFAPILVWAERRQSSMIQDRTGPYMAGVWVPKIISQNAPLLGAGAYWFGVALCAFAALCVGMIGAEWALMNTETTYEFPTWAPVAALLAGLLGVVHVVIGKLLPLAFYNGKLSLFGLLHTLTDVIKAIFKEDFVPPGGDKFLHAAAPIISLIPALATFAAIPFGPTFYLDYWNAALPNAAAGSSVVLQVANVNIGILYIFAIAGTGIVGAALAGYSSDNKYSLLGGLRAASQMVSYEVTLGLSLVGCFMLYGTLHLGDMVRWQMENGWGVFYQPLALILFLAASTAETKRVPFDSPEGESEIVAGYFLEYSGLKFIMFMMAEFLEIVTGSAIVATLFFGGYHIPWLLGANGWQFGAFELASVTDPRFLPLVNFFNSHTFIVVAQIHSFLLKTAIFCWFSLMVRWTLPRFRYDQIMRLCWKGILPLSLLNLFLTGLFIAFRTF